MLKLVRYKILFVKRDYEYAFPEQEELISGVPPPEHPRTGARILSTTSNILCGGSTSGRISAEA